MTAAELGLSGIDPLVYLNEKDRHKQAILTYVAQASRRLREHDAQQLAVQIANNVGQLFEGRSG